LPKWETSRYNRCRDKDPTKTSLAPVVPPSTPGLPQRRSDRRLKVLRKVLGLSGRILELHPLDFLGKRGRSAKPYEGSYRPSPLTSRANCRAIAGHVVAQNLASGGAPGTMARAHQTAGMCHGAMACKAIL
jgi:hypothetical protein